MTRSVSSVPETLNAFGERALIVNRDPSGSLILANHVSDLDAWGVPLAPGESIVYDLSSDRAIKGSAGPTPVLYDLLPGGTEAQLRSPAPAAPATLFGVAPAGVSANLTTGQVYRSAVVNVSPFNPLVLNNQMNTSGGLFALQWSKSADGSQTVAGSTPWREDGTGLAGGFSRVFQPLAAFAQLVVSAVTANGTISYQMFELPVPLSQAVFPPQTLISQQAVALGASVTANAYPGPGYTGRMHCWANVGAAATVKIQRTNGSFAMETILQKTLAAAGDVDFDFNAPLDMWRVSVTNTTAGATTFSLGVVGPV